MESILKEINNVLGVAGCLVCLPDGTLAAAAMPERLAQEQTELAARIVGQTLQALEMSGQRIVETDLVFGDGRLLIKNLSYGTLAILCARNINLPLLNLATTNAIKKLNAQLQAPAAPTPSPAPAPSQAAPPLVAASNAPVAPVAANSAHALYAELEKEAHRLIAAGQTNATRLVVMDPLAVWMRCPQTRELLTPPQKRQLDFVGLAEQAPLITRVLERAGYQANARFNALYGRRRLNFQDPLRLITVNVFLDAFEMYHRFDLRRVIQDGETVLPATAVLLTRLQIVESTDANLRDACALLNEYDLTLTPDQGKINVPQITTVCAAEWGWYKTVTLNLANLIAYAEDELPPVQRERVIQRARALQSNIEATPKSLRWLTRAGLGETVRWYDTPINVQAASTRPDMSLS